MSPIDAGNQQKTYLVNKAGFEESSVDVSTSFEQQSADSEVLPKCVHGVREIDRGFSGDDERNAFLPKHCQVVLWSLLTDDTNQVVAIKIAT